MKIIIVSPLNPKLNSGNRTTARRWRRILRSLGHRVEIATGYDDQSADVMIALHARRSATFIRRFRDTNPDRSLLLAMTGTDLYQDIRTSKSARTSLDIADRLILLQPDGTNELSVRLRKKCRVIYQSALPPRTICKPIGRHFEVCVIGHLRSVKDPFRTALAARMLPSESRIRVVHFGSALTDDMRKRAEAEMKLNPRYKWYGNLPHWKTMQRLARSRLMVLTSKLEGGAHVVTEAVVAGVPVISSRISGSIGLLGADHPGYFDVGDTHQLAKLMLQAESDRAFYRRLKKATVSNRSLFHPRAERNAWRKLLSEIA